MRIGFVGNVNNRPAFFCEAARRLGFEAYLYPVHRSALHDPRSRFPDGEPEWVRRIVSVEDWDLVRGGPGLDALVADVRERCDFVVLNGGLLPSLSRRLELPFVVHASGSEVTYYARFEALRIAASGWDPDYRRSSEGRDQMLAIAETIALQRDAILGADAFSGVHPRGLVTEIEQVLADIGLDGARRISLRAVDLDRIEPSPWPDDAPGAGLRVCSPVRVDFLGREGDSELDYKGTERLIEGFSEFLREGCLGTLTLVEKGHDVDAAKALCRELRVDGSVEWVRDLPFSEYRRLLSDAHVVCDAISLAGPAGVTHEAMATRRPVIANLRPDVFESVYDGGYPGVHVESAAEVAHALLAAYRSPQLLAETADEGRRFAETRLAPAQVLSRELLPVLERRFG